MVVEWDRPLKYRRGSPRRLDGIDLFFDFEWFEVFPDGRAQFKNGQCLAQLVRGDCPEGKIPALLLTTRDDVEERPIETDSHFVVVLNLPRYLAQATADAAASYYAHRLGSGITGLAQLHEFAAQPDVISAVVDRELSVEHIAAWSADDPKRIEQLREIAGVADASRTKTDLPRSAPDARELARRPDVIKAVVNHALQMEHIAAWASGNADRIEQLRELAGAADSSRAKADLRAVVAALQALESLDAEIVTAIEGLLGRDMDRDARLRFLRALTADRLGRDVTSEVLGQRVSDRLADARYITITYSNLLEDLNSTETDLQQFIEANPWLLGLDYVRVRPRRALPRGEMDFILERYDGFHDLLELKSPQDPIVTAPDVVDGVPPAASAFALSPDLSQALAQVHVYRDVLTADAEAVDRRYGLRNTRDPRVFIVIGQVNSLPPHRSRVLRDLNLSLHRVEIVPYDVLAERARTILDNVELHLSASREEPAQS